MKENSTFESFIFTHIPKCGGTSFRQYVSHCAEQSGVQKEEMYIPGIFNLANNKNIPQLNQDEIMELRRKDLKVVACHCKFEVQKTYELNIPKPFFYTILREPVKRFMSHYNFFYYHLGYNNCKGVSINDLPPDKLDFLVSSLANVQVNYISNVTAYKAIGHENIGRIAKHNLEHEYGCFGILEHMEESLRWLEESCGVVNFGGDIEFPVRNTFKKSDPSLLPSEEIVRKIKEYNAADVDLYEFSLKIFKNR